MVASGCRWACVSRGSCNLHRAAVRTVQRGRIVLAEGVRASRGALRTTIGTSGDLSLSRRIPHPSPPGMSRSQSTGFTFHPMSLCSRYGSEDCDHHPKNGAASAVSHQNQCNDRRGIRAVCVREREREKTCVGGWVDAGPFGFEWYRRPSRRPHTVK